MMCSPQDTPNAGMNTQGSTKIVLELSVEENGAIACRTAPYNDECCENGENNAIDGFSDFEVRQRFKTRVYSLLTCQLLILISICLSVNEILHLFRLDGEIAIKTIVFTSFIQVLMVVVVYCNRGKWLRVFPANFLVLSTFTFANAVSISVADNAFRCNVLLYSIQVISLAFLVLTIFAAQNWIKYSWCRALLLATIILLPALTLIEYITQDASTPSMLELGIVIALIALCFFIIIDLNSMTTGRRPKYFLLIEIFPKDYVLAVLVLYMDLAVLIMVISISYFSSFD